jgi:hypothetical protein
MTEPICNICVSNKCTLKKGEEYYKTCEECRTKDRLKKYCEHNKRKATCRDCKGSALCIHDKEKRKCRDCKGSAICIHDKQKTKCRDCDFKQYLINLQRTQINRCFKYFNNIKNKHSIEYLGCTIEEFIEHFNKKIKYFNENLITNEIMTYDNIHIDHIKPVSVFNLDNEEEFLDCCHYTNLQPLLVKDNLEKHNRWSEDNEIYWEKNIKSNSQYSEVYMV